MTNVIVTAYCACSICCGPSASGLTASGLVPKQGITIAASRNIKFGTKIALSVPGYFTNKTFTVQDRLAKRFDNRIDIYFTKHSDAKKFGIHKINLE